MQPGVSPLSMSMSSSSLMSSPRSTAASLIRRRRLAGKNLRKACTFYIPAAEDDGDVCVFHILTLLQQRGERSRTGPFRHLMRVIKVHPHCLGDGIFADFHKTGRAATNGRDRLAVWLACRQSIREGFRERRGNGSSGGER